MNSPKHVFESRSSLMRGMFLDHTMNSAHSTSWERVGRRCLSPSPIGDDLGGGALSESPTVFVQDTLDEEVDSLA